MIRGVSVWIVCRLFFIFDRVVNINFFVLRNHIESQLHFMGKKFSFEWVYLFCFGFYNIFGLFWTIYFYVVGRVSPPEPFITFFQAIKVWTSIFWYQPYHEKLLLEDSLLRFLRVMVWNPQARWSGNSGLFFKTRCKWGTGAAWISDPAWG